jgi:hypothetical protein
MNRFQMKVIQVLEMMHLEIIFQQHRQRYNLLKTLMMKTMYCLWQEMSLMFLKS